MDRVRFLAKWGKPKWTNLSVVDHPASVYEQQHVVDSLLHVFSQDIKATRPLRPGGLKHKNTRFNWSCNMADLYSDFRHVGTKLPALFVFEQNIILSLNLREQHKQSVFFPTVTSCLLNWKNCSKGNNSMKSVCLSQKTGNLTIYLIWIGQYVDGAEILQSGKIN